MYKILESSKRMSTKQIMNEFNGKWVFLVDLDRPPTGWFKSAVPAVIADEPFAGSETGIYDELDEKYKGNTTAWSFLSNELNVFGFNEVQSNDN